LEQSGDLEQANIIKNKYINELDVNPTNISVDNDF